MADKSRLIGTADAKLYDGSGMPQTEHDLISGMAVVPGKVVITEVTTTNTVYPMAATMISEDESQVVPGAANLTDAGSPAKWSFTWDDLPELGCDAILRLEELAATEASTDRVPFGFRGATLTLTLNVVSDVDDVICVGPAGTGLTQPDVG
jgi:hypothetical protein